jgi:hypothetical protein
MSRDQLLRRIETLERRLPDAKEQATREAFCSLTDLELAELAAAVYEREGILLNPLCVEEEIGCECRREAWDLLNQDSPGIDVRAAAKRLHRGEEANVACLYFIPGCECRQLATAVLAEATPHRIRFEARLLHGAKAVTEAPSLPSPDPPAPDPADEPPKPSEVQEEPRKPVPTRRSCDLPPPPYRPTPLPKEEVLMWRPEEPPAEWGDLL